MGNPFVQIELNTTDPGSAKSFHQALFDWKIEDVNMGGGMMTHPMPGKPSVWLP